MFDFTLSDSDVALFTALNWFMDDSEEAKPEEPESQYEFPDATTNWEKEKQ